ncbi:MAG: HAMP domain-containing histidine kinase [Desulfobacteraceae bacterium]|nr:HAMP domain-containing histidine kinase [Desulfobacteraceae bacterium]
MPKDSDVIESPAKPLKIAFTVSLVFFAAGVVYILLSSRLAAITAATVPNLAYIEQIKGILFIVFTALLLFLVIYLLMLKIDAQQRKLLNFGNRMIAAERRATAVVFADAVAHDLGHVLMNLEYYTEELAEAAGKEKPEALKELNNSLARLNRLTRRIGDVSGHLIREKKQYINLPTAVRDALGFAGKHKNVGKCQVDLKAPEELMFMGNLLLIYQMIINLVLNAAEAVGSHGRILVRVLEYNDSVALEVHDNGPGIEENSRKVVMEPFYSTKKQGNGLGLLSVQACANAHQGKVEIVDSDLGGACFSVSLKKSPAVINDAVE